jgi:ParB-like chromosome segregation protein Spo0J
MRGAGGGEVPPQGVNMEHIREVKEIEIGRLELIYAHTRIERPERISSLALSIERIGQIVPVIVLKSLVLLDGYLRVRALKRLGKDMVVAEIWEVKEEDALVSIIARASSRKWELLEEAALLHELHDRHHLSQERIASMVGRTQGWVSTRLALYDALTPDLMDLIRKGTISTWTATRVIVPIARAIPEHGMLLSENIKKVSLSTREMAEFFRHYQKSGRGIRDKMVHDPHLFLKSLRTREDKALKEGPEGKWLNDMRVITHMLKGLCKEVPTLFCQADNLERRILLTALEDGRKQFMELEREIGRYDNDYRRDEAGHLESERTGHPFEKNSRDPQTLPQYRQTGRPGRVAKTLQGVSP